MKQKYHLAMDDAGRRLLIGSLNDLRSRIFTEGRYTDAVDEVLLKMLKVFSFVYPASVPIDLCVEYHISRFIVCVNSKAKGFLYGCNIYRTDSW